MRRLAYALLATHWVLAVYWFARLPERVPIHFNFRGEADRWTNDATVVWFLLPALSTILVGVLGSVERFTRNAPQLWNVPEKKKFLALSAEQRAPIITQLMGIVDLAAAYSVALLLYVQIAMYQSAVAGQSRLSWPFHVLTWGGLIVLLVAALRKTAEIRHMIRRASQEETIGRTS